MSSFNEYVEKKYPSYNTQKKLLSGHNRVIKDLTAKNIENTLKTAEKLNANTFSSPSVPHFNSKSKSIRINELDQAKPLKVRLSNSAKSPKKPILKESMNKEATNKESTVNLVTSNSNATGVFKSNKVSKSILGLEGYELDDYKTSPPVGWKRPASTTSIMIKQMFDNKQNALTKSAESPKRSKLDKDIYFEAIYREDVGGQIFMKYLISRHKSVIEIKLIYAIIFF